MFTLDFVEGRCYTVRKELFEVDISKDRIYTIREDSKFHYLSDSYNMTHKGQFSIVRLIKERFNILHPFKKRELIEVVVNCIDNKTIR